MKRKIILGLSLVLLGSVTAMGVYAATGQNGNGGYGNGNGYGLHDGSGHHRHDENHHNNQVNAQNAKVKSTDAENTVKNKLPGCQIVENEYKYKHGRNYYEVEAVKDNNKYEYKIDAQSGKIFSEECEERDEWCTENDINAMKTKINLAKAKEIALNGNNGYKVTDFKLEKDDGQFEYEIKISNGTDKKEVKIDANTGNVLKVENDD